MLDHTPEVLLITGPAGAGKTAVAQRWALTCPYECAQISLDDVRLMVKSGYADPQDGWGPIYTKMAPWRDRDDAIVIDNSCLSLGDTVAAMEGRFEATIDVS
jgi:cytidylate kinase